MSILTKTFVMQLFFQIQDELKAWGLEFERNLVDVKGRILPPVTMLFANNSTFPVDQKGDFTMAFRGDL